MGDALSPPRSAVGAGLRHHDTATPDVETASEAYAQRFAGPVGAWMLAVQSQTLLALLEAIPGKLSILDVGGGHGQLVAPLRAAGHRVVVHGSRPVCHARRGLEPSARVAADPWRLPFAEGAFDVVIAVRLLAHVEAWQELLAEMARVARRGVAVDFPARGALHRLAPALFGAKRRLEGSTRPYFDYVPDEVTEALRATGLPAQRSARQFAWPMVLHRTLRAPALSRTLEALARALGLTARLGSPVLMLALRPADAKAVSRALAPGEERR